MKFSDIERADQLRTQRRNLKAMVDVVATSDVGLQATILGKYLDDAMIARIRPVVLDEMKARLAENERALAAIGVEID